MSTYAGRVKIELAVGDSTYECVQINLTDGELWLSSGATDIQAHLGKTASVTVTVNDEVVRQFSFTLRKNYGDSVTFD